MLGLLLVLSAYAGAGTRVGELPVASGVLSDAAGKGLPGEVLVYAPPATGSGKLQLVADVKTDDGTFAASVAPSSLIAQLAKQNDGFVNFEFVAVVKGFYGVRTLARKLGDGAWVDRDGATGPGQLVVAKGAPGVAPRKVHNAERLPSAGGCVSNVKKVGLPFAQPTTIGELHTVSGLKATFSYGQTADTDVGTLFNGGSGWSVAADAHVGNSRSSRISITRSGEWGHELRTKFTYQRYRYLNSCTGAYDRVLPLGWVGSGLTVGADVHAADHQCGTSGFATQSAAGTTFDTATERSYRYSAGVSLFGIGVNATSGFSTRVTIDYQFVAAGVICGDTDFPASAPRIFAGR